MIKEDGRCRHLRRIGAAGLRVPGWIGLVPGKTPGRIVDHTETWAKVVRSAGLTVEQAELRRNTAGPGGVYNGPPHIPNA